MDRYSGKEIYTKVPKMLTLSFRVSYKLSKLNFMNEVQSCMDNFTEHSPVILT